MRVCVSVYVLCTQVRGQCQALSQLLFTVLFILFFGGAGGLNPEPVACWTSALPLCYFINPQSFFKKGSLIEPKVLNLPRLGGQLAPGLSACPPSAVLSLQVPHQA